MSHFFFFSSRRRHTRSLRDWSSDVCSSDLLPWRQLRCDRSTAGLGDVMAQNGDQPAVKAAEAAARRSYGKLVAYLASRAGDVAAAEDALADAFASALADWPRSGVPRNPEAWLTAVAKRRL